jgi:hypothetical protein
MLIATDEMCPGCRKGIDPTDDMVAIAPGESARALPAGTYHRECLAQVPDRDQVVAKWRDNVVAAIRTRSDSVKVVGQGRGYVIVCNSADEQIVLFYLNHMAAQSFNTLNQWRDFAAQVKAFDPVSATWHPSAPPELGSSEVAVRLDGRIVVSWTESVGLEVDLAKANYDLYVERFGPLRGTVNFAELVAAGKLAPVQVEGSLEKNRGVVRDIRLLGAIYVVSLDALRCTELPLAPDEFRELQRAVAGVKM